MKFAACWHTTAQRGTATSLAARRLTPCWTARLSDDVDVFHDTETAVAASWEMDRTLLDQNGFTISLLRQFPTFIEAEIARDAEALVMQWAYDSAFRFFP